MRTAELKAAVHRYSQVSLTGLIAAHDAQPHLDQVGIVRVDLEARAQAMHGGVRRQRDVRDLAGRSGQVDRQAVGLLARADDVENENAPLAVEARARAGGHDLAHALRQPGLGQPAQAVGELGRMPGGETLRRAPESHDVVVALAARGNLHQLDRARAPVALRLDPGARPPLVLVLEILEIALVARALHQPEPCRRPGGERRYLQLRGIRQLAEDVLAGARGDLQTVRVVHLGAIVIEPAAVGLVEQEHRGERRDPHHAQFGSREQRARHVHHGDNARLHREAVGAGDGVALEQRIDHDRGCVRRRLLDPEMRECREFLARGLRGVDGESARREAVEQALRDGAEIARALKHQKLVPDLLRVDLRDETESRQRQRDLAELRQRGRDLEHGRRGDEIVRGAVLDRRDGHRRGLLVEGRSQELQAERQLLIAPDRRVAIEVDAAVLLRAQLVEPRRQGAALRSVGLRRQPLGFLEQRVEAECISAGGFLGARLRGVRVRAVRG